MVYRLSARKGAALIRSGSSRKDIIIRKAERLRADGWRVRVYKVKKGGK